MALAGQNRDEIGALGGSHVHDEKDLAPTMEAWLLSRWSLLSNLPTQRGRPWGQHSAAGTSRPMRFWGNIGSQKQKST